MLFAAVVEPAVGPTVISVSGSAVVIVHANETGVVSRLPAASIAVISNVCAPSSSEDNVSGETHGVAGAPSSEHSNVTGPSASSPSNTNSGLVLLSSAGGPITRRVAGAAVSIRHANIAGVSSTFALNAAATENVCMPSASVTWSGGTQTVGSAPSTLQKNPFAVPTGRNENCAVASLVTASGCESISVSGVGSCSSSPHAASASAQTANTPRAPLPVASNDI